MEKNIEVLLTLIENIANSVNDMFSISCYYFFD